MPPVVLAAVALLLAATTPTICEEGLPSIVFDHPTEGFVFGMGANHDATVILALRCVCMCVCVYVCMCVCVCVCVCLGLSVGFPSHLSACLSSHPMAFTMRDPHRARY